MQKKQSVLATKVGMTQIFMDDGVLIPVTVLHVQENIVVQKKIPDTHGYSAVQVAYGDIREKNINKPRLGYFKKRDITPKRILREFRLTLEDIANFEEGKSTNIAWLKEAGSVDVSGTSKGKGFAGVMKRHNFSGFRRTHGTHESFRGGGSIGQCEYPGKVFKGKKMAGQMGSERVTVKNIGIVRFNEDERILCLRGGIPGSKGAVVEIELSNRRPKLIQGISGPKEEKGLKNPMKASKAGGKK